MLEPDRPQPLAALLAGSLQGGLGDLIPVGVFRASASGQLQSVNRAFRRLLSLAESATIERLNLTDLFGVGVLQAAPGRPLVVTPALNGRRTSQLELTLIASRDGHGQPLLEGVLVAPSDIADTEEEDPSRWPRSGETTSAGSAEAARFESIGRVAGSVAHDIANLVTTISGYGSLLQKSLPENDPRHPDLDGILTAAERCCAMARKLLDTGRRKETTPPLLDVVLTTEELMGVLQKLVSNRGQLVWRRSARTLLVGIDRLQFEQVLLNLVGNARDALRHGGTLKIEALVSSVLPGDERLPAGEYVRLSVSDEGAGMEAETVQRIFEPFFSTKGSEHNSGLGLSTVRSVVEAHGGDIRVVSTLGSGSCFTVLLPLLS